MPFDPKLIPADDAPLLPSGEIDLPADLAALGEQLRDDAQHLARRYPAGGDVVAVRPAASRTRPWTKIAVLATSGLATALAVVVAVQVVGPLGNRRQAMPAVGGGAEHQPIVAADRAASKATESIPATSPPTISLTELSGPELEALIDLWQREPTPKEGTGIAF
jgi:hypothetical protein